MGKETLQWWIQGRGPGARLPPPHLIFRPKWGPKGRKKFFFRRGPALISGSGWPAPPPTPLIWRSGSVNALSKLKKNWAVPPLLACKIFSRFFRSLGRAPWNSFSNFSWQKIPCTFYAPWSKKWCLISAFTTQTSGFTSLINYWRIISLWTISF